MIEHPAFPVEEWSVREREFHLDTLAQTEPIFALRNGGRRRIVRGTSPAARTIQVPSVRMVSFTQRAIVAISYEVEPIDAPVRVVMQSELVANEDLPDQGKDPRVGAALASALESEEHQARGTLGLLIHHTRVSNLRIGAVMDHHVEGPAGVVVESESLPDIARVTVTTRLKPGE